MKNNREIIITIIIGNNSIITIENDSIITIEK